MSYEIVSSVVFALILFRLIEDSIEYTAEKLLQRKRNKEFKDLMAKLEASFPPKLTDYDDKTCGDPYCDICEDGGNTYTIPVVKKKPVKKTVKKTVAKRPVKKTAAKKKAVKRK